MSKPKLLISSCLVGENVKYNGGNNLIPDLKTLKEKFELFLVCPEVLGGMAIPRVPSEIISFEPLKVENKIGEDVTDFFENGAKIVLNICKKYNIKVALLKSNSPSCGNKTVYDGTFSGKLIDKMGITTNLLVQNNIKVFNEYELKDLYEYIT